MYPGLGRRSRFCLKALFLILTLLPVLTSCSGFVAEPRRADFYIVGYLNERDLESQIAVSQIVERIPEINAALIKLFPGQLEAIKASGKVRYLFKPKEYHWLYPEVITGQSLTDFQWHLNFINVNALWQWGLGNNVTVSLLDTGIDATHQDLRGTILPGIDAATGAALPNDRDFSEGSVHGTHVAGIVGAHGEVVGVAPRAKILPVRIFNPNYVGDFKAAAALVAAHKAGASIFNLSFGGFEYSPVLQDAISFLVEKGDWVVAAAGNRGDSRPFYPAAMPGVVAVGALDGQGRMADFSNRGLWVDVFAPGVNIYSTVPGNRYAFLSGTSMAAPIVTGIAAALRERRPNLDPWGLAWLFKHYGVNTRFLLANLSNAPKGGCLRLQLTSSHGPVQNAWVRLLYADEHDSYSASSMSDLQGYVSFYAIPQGDARVSITADFGGATRIHYVPLTVYRNCSWVEKIELPF